MASIDIQISVSTDVCMFVPISCMRVNLKECRKKEGNGRNRKKNRKKDRKKDRKKKKEEYEERKKIKLCNRRKKTGRVRRTVIKIGSVYPP